jgi:translation initiation factor IF-1
MAKQENLSFTGIVTEELGNSMFRVSIDNMEVPPILCTISGKIRKNFIKIVAGDKVKFEVSPYDLTRGRIITRMNTSSSSVSDESNFSINNKSKKK